MDRHWSATIRSQSFWSVKIHDQNTAKRSVTSSRNWWSSKIWRPDREIEGKVCWYVVVDSQIWGPSLAKGGGRKKRFQYCLSPYSSNELLYFRAVQGHSAENFVDIHHCKTVHCYRVTLPSNIGNACEAHSIIQSGLIPGGKSCRRDRQSVFFAAVGPMDDNQDPEEVQHNLDNPRIAPHKHTWRSHHNTVYWCRERDCDSVKLDRMQLLFETHYRRLVSIEGFAWKQGKNFTAEDTSHPRHLA